MSPTECVLSAPVPQMGTELVEVPQVMSQSEFQQHSVEQTVRIPVRGGVGQGSAALRGADSSVGRQGFPSRQVSTALRGADSYVDLQRFPSRR